MPNQYSSLTKKNILTKVNRKTNPVTSLAQLAREFGYSTAFFRASGPKAGRMDHTVPPVFRTKVRRLVGTTNLNEIRRREHINYGFEGSLNRW